MSSLVESPPQDAVSRLLDDLVGTRTVAGANVLILKSGEEQTYHEAGLRDVEAGLPLARDTLFRVFSMTKPVTAAAVMILVDQGSLRLDDPVAAYVPELADLEVHTGAVDEVVSTEPARPMTIRHLLTHTAGFSYWFQPLSPVAAQYDTVLNAGRFEPWRFDPAHGGLSGLAKALAKVPLVSQPGATWHYSLALEVAGLVVERASGRRLDTFMTERIFTPLAMHDTAFSVRPDAAGRFASMYGPTPEGGLELLEAAGSSPLLGEVPGLSGGGGLVSTIDDYAKFAQMLANRGTLNGQRVLSETAVAEMMRSQLEPAQLAELPMLAAFGLGGTGEGLGFGLGGAVVVDPDATTIPAYRGEYAWGGAASTTFWVDPVNELVVVFMTQLAPPSPEMLRDRLHTAIYGA
jgi:CubicO group peptidase (beta-lactamase class C family)